MNCENITQGTVACQILSYKLDGMQYLLAHGQRINTVVSLKGKYIGTCISNATDRFIGDIGFFMMWRKERKIRGDKRKKQLYLEAKAS